jgi:hypothetical protein
MSSDALAAGEIIVLSPSWNKPRRIALRFLVCYFALYAPVVLSDLGFLGFPTHWYDSVWQQTSKLIGGVFGITKRESMYVITRPDDGALLAARAITFALMAVVGTVMWTRRVTDSQADDYRIYHWLRIGLRYVLAYASIHFAIVGLFRFQFPGLTPESLITPVGDMRPNELLWAFFGWSWIFTSFLGLSEIAAGALLLRRETTLLGALLLGTILSNVVLLNFTFDVPEKSLSPHLLAMMTVLVLPDAKRLFDVHVLGKSVPPADMGWDVPSDRALTRRKSFLKKCLIVLMVASPLFLIWKTRGYLFHHAKSPLAALYEVSSFTRDGQERPPIVGDSLRWRRAVISKQGDVLHVQMADSKWFSYGMAADTVKHRIALTAPIASEWRSAKPDMLTKDTPRQDTVSYMRTRAGHLELKGNIAKHALTVTLERVDTKQLEFFKSP